MLRDWYKGSCCLSCPVIERLLLFPFRQSIHQLSLPNLALNEQHYPCAYVVPSKDKFFLVLLVFNFPLPFQSLISYILIALFTLSAFTDLVFKHIYGLNVALKLLFLWLLYSCSCLIFALTAVLLSQSLT